MLALTIDIDPEIENDCHLLIHATGVDLTVDQAVETQWEWNRQLFECCPAPLVCVFRLWVEGIR